MYISNILLLGDFAFSELTALTIIELSSGLTVLGNDMFKQADSLQRIVIPSTITSVGK
jgi:hypothetical protein